jgi:S-DNA-T family DNA segregation ATPase FtsK/SpoIIIE
LDTIGSVERIMQKGPNHGVHAIISTTGWIANQWTSPMRNLFGSNVELRLGTMDDFTINNKDVAHDVPFGQLELHKPTDESAGESEEFEVIKIRGRGTTMDGFHGQVGLPEMGDGSDVAAAVAAVAQPLEAVRVAVLPERIELAEVLGRWEPRPGLVPFGVSERGLVPAAADFAAYPHLILTGRAECGLSSGLRTIAQSVMRHNTPAQARVYVCDPNNDQILTVEGDHLGGYGFEEQPIRDLISEVASILQTRLPSSELGQRELAAAVRDWDGPELFVLVDREEALAAWDQGTGMINPNTGHPLAPLVPFIGRARQVGLHLLIGRNIAQWQTYPNAAISALLKAKSPAIIMDGDPQDGFVIGNVKAVRSQPGRGIYLTDRTRTSVQIALPETANLN